MSYRVFFQYYRRGESTPSMAPLEVDLRRLLRLLERLEIGDDYLGLLDPDDRVVQIQRLEDDLYPVEIPDLARRQGLCRPFTRAALGEWLEGLPRDFSQVDLEAFAEVPW